MISFSRPGKYRIGAACVAALACLVGGDARAQAASPAGVAASWSARPTTEVRQETRAFTSQGATLSGTLHLPVSGRPVGAMVVLHGASSPLRTSPLYDHLLEMMPALGIAVFVYDRRGAGQSQGDRRTADFAQLADDAIAARRMLASDPRIAADRVGVWGLSQGGWLALLAASRDPAIAFVVSISAPLVPPDVQMLFSSENSLRVNGFSQPEIDQMIATRRAVDDYMRGTTDRETAQRLVDAAKTEPWFRYLYMGETVHDREGSRWRREIEHDPLGTLDGIAAPTLILFGAVDPVVPVEISFERLGARSRPHVRVEVVAGADHGMQTGVDPRVSLEPSNADASAPNAAGYFGLLSSWLTQQGLVDHR